MTTGCNEFIVCGDLRRAIEQSGLSGAAFGPITFRRRPRSPMQPFWECLIENVLPPFSKNSVVCRDGVCARCGRGCSSDLIGGGTVLAYSRASIASVDGFNVTWEQSGVGQRPGLGQRARHARLQPAGGHGLQRGLRKRAGVSDVRPVHLHGHHCRAQPEPGGAGPTVETDSLTGRACRL